MRFFVLDWQDLVNKHYGDIAHFEDAPTVRLVRADIAENRAMLKKIIDCPITVSALNTEELSEFSDGLAKLDALDAKLCEWQKRKQSGDDS